MEAKTCDSPYKYTQIWVVFPYFYECSVMLSKFVWGAKLIFSWGTVISRVVVQPLSHVSPFATPGTTALQASLSFTISRSLLNLMSIELVMPSKLLVLCHPLLLPSIFPSIKVFFNESALCIRWPNYWSFSFGISHLIFLNPTTLTPVALSNN